MNTPPLPSIRRRLARALVVVSLAWGVAVSAVVWLVVRHEVDEIMDATLREASQILGGLLSYDLPHLPLGVGNALPAPPHDEDLVWQLVDAAGQVLLRSHRAPLAPLTDPRQALAEGFVTVDGAWRVHAAPFAAPFAAPLAGAVPGVGPELTLLVGQTAAERHEARLEAAEFTSGAALLVGLLCALWLSRRVQRELLPLSELSAAVRGFDPLKAGAALLPAQRQELQPLWQAVTELGARLAQRVANERAFSAHAAHALRTPLAGMVAQLAVAQRLSPPQAQPMLSLTRNAANRLRRVVTALLTLFRSGTQVQWQHVDLVELLPQLQVPGLSLRLAAPAQLQADPDLLAAALSNLLDNALRHGASQVQLQLAQGLEQGVAVVWLRVQDDGPGVADAARSELQNALDTQGYEGRTGLGLMLADLVARAHGGGLQLPPTDAGFAVVLRLPQARPAADAGAAAGVGAGVAAGAGAGAVSASAVHASAPGKV